MPEPKVISISSRVPTDVLRRAAARLSAKKYPKRCEVLHITLAIRQAVERGQGRKAA